uniref:DUF2058 domain-containing protein n=1 Tax=uncultured Thiotrichaceae bacterium TaxID=298394 RepID=A0A6S6TMW3_9GAMM|nr:MAG: Unknown protein [uncultured Thiotrichaceae bacterium]
MSNSLSDQLLKAGLVTQNQIDQSEEKKQQQKARAKSKAKDHKAGKNNKPNTSRQNQSKPKIATPNTNKPAKKGGSDLAQFYQQRNQLERKERETEEQAKREAAAHRKKVRKQLRELIAEHTKNDEEASVRFNFVVGETVKYLYVTEEQQQAISDGKLSITFMDGKRCLIPPEIGVQILALDNSKIVINFKDDESNSH